MAAILFDRQDFLYSLRSARRTPLLTGIAVLALSVGIGLNTAVFTIVNMLLLAPPVRENPSTFAQIYPHYEGWYTGSSLSNDLNSDDLDAVRSHTQALSEVAAWQLIAVTQEETRRKSAMQLVTCNYLQVIDVGRPLMGRFFDASECVPGSSARVVVLGEIQWKSQLNSDPNIVGKTIHLSGQTLTVIGVASADHTNHLPAGIWAPYTLQPLFNHGNSAFKEPWPWLTTIGRLGHGYTRSQAAVEIQTILQSRDALYRGNQSNLNSRKTSVIATNGSFIAVPSRQSIVFGLIFLILGPLSLVLLLACTNITMLFLSRVLMRRGELAVRLALGAGRARLMRMLALESVLVATTSGLISIVLAARLPGIILKIMDPLEASDMPAVHPDWRVFTYLGLLVVVATVASAIAPLAESFRLDLVTALKGREGAVTARSRSTSILIFAQIAMSFVLLAAAVLFVRLPSSIANVDTGFDMRSLITVPLQVELPPYTQASAQEFYRDLEARIERIPGVRSIAYASVPIFSTPAQQELRMPQQPKGQGLQAGVDEVSSAFFMTYGIPLLRGRTFASSDLPATGDTTVAIVTRAFARELFGDTDPIGKLVVTNDNRTLTIVGVVQDVRSEHFGSLDGPRLYTLRNANSIQGGLYVRFAGDPTPIIESIRQTVRNLDPTQPDIPISIKKSLEEDASQMAAVANIIVGMATVAVILAMTGLFAVLNFVVQRRTREFGIQMVLGASRGVIFRGVLHRGILQIAAGLVGGLVLAAPAAWWFGRMTQRSLIPVHPMDATIYVISALLLTAVSLCAMSLPALRATRVDPMQSLRNE
ncbi:putative permease [Granulicella aggregans]|uniref:Putative permease n=1 Tax=Granulicella aggregans TaxID=474949 RepID=A0A7W7ZI05_9BACT|nr:ABC transporter permease [Granulicella aggregans]MBB5060262.1 putative permease [Granulicella aggregans]